MRKAHTYDETTDTDEFFFSGRAWWGNWAALVLFFAIEVGSFYTYQRQGGVASLVVPILCAGIMPMFALGIARRSQPVLVISGNELEHVDLITWWLRPKKLSIDGVTAVSDINGMLHLRFESGAFERVPLRLIEASARSAVVESINRRISNLG